MNNYYDYKNHVILDLKELGKLGYNMKEAIKFVESGKANGFIQECWNSGEKIHVVSDHIWQWSSLGD